MGMEGFLPSGNLRMDKQLKFAAEIDKMTGILRRTLLLDRSRRENDAEHSWHIAVMALLFEEYAKEPVDIRRAAEMCVVHDLVEIYAGDTFAYDTKGNQDKAAREAAAADRLFGQLPEERRVQGHSSPLAVLHLLEHGATAIHILQAEWPPTCPP